MVEQVGVPDRWFSGVAGPSRTGPRREMSAQETGDRADLVVSRFGGRQVRDCHVVGQGDSIPGAHGKHLMDPVGVEDDGGRLGRATPKRHRAIPFPHDELPSGVPRGEGDDERRHHRVALLRVLVREEELPLLVDEDRVKVCRQDAAVGQGQHIACLAEQVLHRHAPVDADEGRLNLPGMPHGGVEAGLLSQPERRR